MTYNNAMKISGYVQFALMLIVLVDVIHSAVPQDRQIDSQILEPFVVDMKAKRPFCNAFTGCGRKRSSTGVVQSLNTASGEGMKIVRLPLPLYRALLRAAASQEINNQIIERQDQPMLQQSNNEYNNRLQEFPQLQEFDIQSQKINPPRDQYES